MKKILMKIPVMVLAFLFMLILALIVPFLCPIWTSVESTDFHDLTDGVVVADPNDPAYSPTEDDPDGSITINGPFVGIKKFLYMIE